MNVPATIQKIIDDAAKKKRKPFTLIAPDGRVFLAMTYDELLRLTAPEFQVNIVKLAVRDMKGRK